MIRKLLFLLFSITLFYNTCNAQSWRRRNDYNEIIIVEKVKKENPTVIVVNNNNKHNHDNNFHDYNNRQNNVYEIDCDDLFYDDKINVSEMWQQTIHFRFGQFRLDTADYPTIENIAKFMEENKHVKIELRGYASKNRGSWESNYKLAERRLKSVCEALLQFGVDIKNRTELRVEGLRNQPYDEDSWNQCVIIKAL